MGRGLTRICINVTNIRLGAWVRVVCAGVLLSGLGVMPATAARQAHHARVTERQLLGVWQDEKDHQNIIWFLPNHTVRIYVPKKTGEYMHVHWMTGSWRLVHGNVLKLKLSLTTNDGVANFRLTTFHISFAHGRMVVRQNGKVVGRQRRLSQAQLKKYLW